MIEYKNITIRFSGQYLFKDLNLSINNNQKALIKGKSGTGKTTLFNLLFGFVRPVQGEIYYNHKQVDENSIWEIRTQIAYLTQDIAIGNGTIEQIINHIFNLRVNKKTIMKKPSLSELLDYFELKEDILKKDINDISGGEKQRIAVIIAILLQRKVFLLDEATSALDYHLKKKVVNYFSENRDLTALIISHDDIWLKNGSFSFYNLEEKKWEQ